LFTSSKEYVDYIEKIKVSYSEMYKRR